MNHNGTLAIIFIYLLMTSLPVARVGRKWQFLVYGTSVTGGGSNVNLYSRFKERLNATSNFAESEYDVRTSDILSSIYDLTGNILGQQFKKSLTESDFQNGNKTKKLLGEENLFPQDVTSSPVVASWNNNSASLTTDRAFALRSADGISDEKKLQMINTSVIVSNADQSNKSHKSNRRQARKIQKASRILRHNPLHQQNLYPRTTTEKRLRSRPSLPSFSSATLDVEREEQSTIFSPPRERPYAILEEQQEARRTKNIDDYGDDWPTFVAGNRSSFPNAGSGQMMNGLAVENIDSEGDGNSDDVDDDSAKLVESSSVKWQKKLQIDDGKRYNQRKNKNWPIPFKREQWNGLIPLGNGNDMEMNEEKEHAIEQQHDRLRVLFAKNNGKHIWSRSTDSFPEVFGHPLGESSSVPSTEIGNLKGNGLNEAIRNANSLLASVHGVASNSNVPIFDLNDSSRRIGKQIATLSNATLNDPNGAGIISVADGNTSVANITNVMERVLDELESLRECKATQESQPEGSPCDVAGSWNSETIGLQFHISISNPSPISSRSFYEGKGIDIELSERLPPRQHDLMECDWFITGNTVKQVGGPFYMTAQKADRFIVATFAGLCKTCGGIPTIFGSWTFVYPANDCQDISLAFESKRDILRKDTLEAKRKHRRDRLKSKNNKEKCSHSLF